MVGRGPALASDRAAALPGFDPADTKDGFPGPFERSGDAIGLGLAQDHGHSDPAVECARHLVGRDSSARLELGEDGWKLPQIHVDDRMRAIGQNPRNILEKSAARNVSKPLDSPFLD
jgi:hypothetical protein